MAATQDPLTATTEHDLLPPNATALERSLSLSGARIERLAVTVTDVWDPALCPENFLPWLAWAMSLDVWQEHWHEQVRREFVRHSVAFHRHKGSPAIIAEAVRRVLALTMQPDRDNVENLDSQLDGTFAIREWWQQEDGKDSGPPLSFEVRLLLGTLLSSVGVPEGTLYHNLRRAIDSVKPLTSSYTLSVGGLEFGKTVSALPAACPVQMARFTVIPQ